MIGVCDVGWRVAGVEPDDEVVKDEGGDVGDDDEVQKVLECDGHHLDTSAVYNYFSRRRRDRNNTETLLVKITKTYAKENNKHVETNGSVICYIFQFLKSG